MEIDVAGATAEGQGLEDLCHKLTPYLMRVFLFKKVGVT